MPAFISPRPATVANLVAEESFSPRLLHQRRIRQMVAWDAEISHVVFHRQHSTSLTSDISPATAPMSAGAEPPSLTAGPENSNLFPELQIARGTQDEGT